VKIKHGALRLLFCLSHLRDDKDEDEYVDGLLNTRRGKYFEKEADSLF
jgi:hypothetical protein